MSHMSRMSFRLSPVVTLHYIPVLPIVLYVLTSFIHVLISFMSRMSFRLPSRNITLHTGAAYSTVCPYFIHTCPYSCHVPHVLQIEPSRNITLHTGAAYSTVCPYFIHTCPYSCHVPHVLHVLQIEPSRNIDIYMPVLPTVRGKKITITVSAKSSQGEGIMSKQVDVIVSIM